MTSTTAIVMVGDAGPGELAQLITGAHLAALADLLLALAACPSVERVLLAYPPALALNLEPSPNLPLILESDPPNAEFHFGQRLVELVNRYQLARVFYLGAGGQPLLTSADLNPIIERLAAADGPTLITNNVRSADWVAFNNAHNLASIVHWLTRDNMLAWRLLEDLGYQVVSQPRVSQPASASTRLDIDTPFDLQVLALHPRTPQHLRYYLAAHESILNLSHLRQAIKVLRTPGSRVTLIGRVAATAWEALGTRQLWTRVFSEERGMVANGRQAQGQVFSFVADYIERAGEAQFMSHLARTSDLVLFDTRVFLAHHALWPSAEDRFASDLGYPEKISDARLRRLTAAVAQAPIPILLGGHNVVSGGLYALLEIAAAVP